MGRWPERETRERLANQTPGQDLRWLTFLTVTSKGQITIPLAIRRKLKLRKGTVLEFDERADHLKAAKAVEVERMRSVVGIAKSELGDKSTREWMEELRGPGG